MQLYQHQQEATDATVPVLRKPDSRATLSMACGTGKTLTSIKIAESVAISENTKIIVFIPGLSLSDQLIVNWVQHAFNGEFTVLPVASAGSSLSGFSGKTTVLAHTTDPKEVENALQTKGRLIVFCTYQSAKVIKTAVKDLDGFSFDFAVMDEAHRTAGSGKSKKSSYIMCLNNDLIPIKSRLFITATPRVLKTSDTAAVKSGEGDYGYSMSDTSVYGDVVYKYPFSRAIHDGMLADYRIWAVLITDQNIREAAQVDSDIDLTGVNFKHPEEKDIKKVVSAKHLAVAAVVEKMFKQGTITGAISFHQDRERSISFSQDAGTFFSHSNDPNLTESYLAHVDGDTSQQDRQKVMEQFTESYNEGRFTMISNCAVFTEGVDVPELDTVVFVDNKTSEISIVQAVGRAVRLNKKNPNKVANVVIPVFLHNDENPEAEVNSSEFNTLYNVIASLRESDNMEVNYAEAVMRQAMRDAGVEVDDKAAMVGVVDSEGNYIAGAEDAPVTIITSGSGEAMEMKSLSLDSYNKFAASCEARLIGYSNSFERNLGNLKAYKELAKNRDLIGSDKPFRKFTISSNERVGSFKIGKEMQKVRDDFDAGVLPKHEEEAYAALGFDLTPLDDIMGDLVALAATFSN